MALRKIEMYALIDEWRTSLLSMKDFSLEKGIPTNIFYYWMRKQARESITKNKSRSKKTSDFIPLEFTPKTDAETISIEISYPNGVQVSCPSNVDASIFKNLIILF